jgi:hypothetical protein
LTDRAGSPLAPRAVPERREALDHRAQCRQPGLARKALLPAVLALAGAVHAAPAALAPVPGCREFAAHLPNLPLRVCEQAGLQRGPASSLLGTPLYLRDRTPLDAEMRQMWIDLLRWMGERLGAGVPPSR